jgi:hypothetical protein
MLLNPVIASAIIINDKTELELITMPTPRIEPKEEFDTVMALWGENSLQSASFVVINSNKLIGSIIGIISKANAVEHKFTFLF